MDDLTALERQIASQLNGFVGPVRPVDEAAIFSVITATQTPKWTIQSMSSATRFVVAGAVVALFGGLLLVAQPFEQQSASVPGATTETTSPVEDAAASVVTGNLNSWYHFQACSPNLAVPEDGTACRIRDVLAQPDEESPRLEMTDERLSGDIAITLNLDGWDFTGDSIGAPQLMWGSVRIENDGGAWEGTHLATHLHVGEDADLVDVNGPIVMQLAGSGDYDGLSAVLYVYSGSVDWDPQVTDDFFEQPVSGIVFPGDLPPDRE